MHALQNLSSFFLYGNYEVTRTECSVHVIYEMLEFTCSSLFPVPGNKELSRQFLYLLLTDSLCTHGFIALKNHLLRKNSLVLILQWLWKIVFDLTCDRDPINYPQHEKETHLFSFANELLGNWFQSHNDLLRPLLNHSLTFFPLAFTSIK